MRMIHEYPRGRAGLSLGEVLIATFVLALGLLGILVLFPLGAMRMAQAIKDDRTAMHNTNTTAMARWVWKEEIGPGKVRYQVNPTFPVFPPGADTYDPFMNAMENPNYPWNPDLGALGWVPAAYQSPYYPLPPAPPNTPTAAIPRNSAQMSYAVFVDPMGWNNPLVVGTAQQFWIGGDNTTIPRRSFRRLEFLRDTTTGLYALPTDLIYPGAKTALMHRYLVMLDDIGYGRDATPLHSDGVNTTGSLGAANMIQQIQREGRYSCGLLLRRSRNSTINSVDMSVVVYHVPRFDRVIQEDVYVTTFIKGSTEVLLDYGASGKPKPNLRKGQWILDGTMVQIVNGRPIAENRPDNEHAVFYRIVSIDDSTPGQLLLEINEPAEATTVNPSTGVVFGRGVIMEGVAEVFRGRSLTNTARPTP